MEQQKKQTNQDIGVKNRDFEPTLYDVILLNDDFTTMEFVVELLRNVFFLSTSQAERVMLNVHENGKGIAGTYDFDTAQSKQRKAERLAREEGYPLRLLIQPHS